MRDVFLLDLFQVSLIDPLIRKHIIAAKKKTFEEAITEALLLGSNEAIFQILFTSKMVLRPPK